MNVKLLLALVALALGFASARAQEDYGFMPAGGKTLLLQLFDTGQLHEIGSAKHTESEWHGLVKARATALSERDINELSAYLAVNLPLSEVALDKARGPEEVAALFPPDGRELAWNQCQFCHSLFSGYLMQDRDAQGWRSIFLSPFHRGMKMTEKERETFARYSAFSMPMKPDDVPAPLRY